MNIAQALILAFALIVGFVMLGLLVWESLRNHREAHAWREVARLTAIIADELIEIHDPDHDEVSAEAREQLRRVREGVIA